MNNTCAKCGGFIGDFTWSGSGARVCNCKNSNMPNTNTWRKKYNGHCSVPGCTDCLKDRILWKDFQEFWESKHPGVGLHRESHRQFLKRSLFQVEKEASLSAYDDGFASGYEKGLKEQAISIDKDMVGWFRGKTQESEQFLDDIKKEAEQRGIQRCIDKIEKTRNEIRENEGLGTASNTASEILAALILLKHESLSSLQDNNKDHE